MKVGICNLKSSTFANDLLKSVINTGFAVITHHNVDHDLIKAAQHEWRQFFTQEQKAKNLYINGNDTNMGYKGPGSETAVGSTVADLKEFYHWKPNEIIPGSVQNVTEKLFSSLAELGKFVLCILEGADANYVLDCDEGKAALFRALYYPALKNVTVEPGAVRSAAHEDINHVTLLVAASAPGLQVKDTQGKWHDVPHEENSIVMNIGDMLQLASKGKYKSTTHRVVNPTDSTSDRISMPFFIHPKPATELAPGYTAGQFLKERLDAIYGKK